MASYSHPSEWCFRVYVRWWCYGCAIFCRVPTSTRSHNLKTTDVNKMHASEFWFTRNLQDNTKCVSMRRMVFSWMTSIQAPIPSTNVCLELDVCALREQKHHWAHNCVIIKSLNQSRANSSRGFPATAPTTLISKTYDQSTRHMTSSSMDANRMRHHPCHCLHVSVCPANFGNEPQQCVILLATTVGNNGN